MQSPEAKQDQQQDDSPPIFKTWNQMYAFVLILHAILITLFYFFTKYYS